MLSRLSIGLRSTSRLTRSARVFQPQTRLSSSSAKFNTCICFVPEKEAWVIERFGKYHKTLEPGLNVIIPIIDQIKYIQVLKEIVIDVSHQSAITSDNVVVHIDGVLYVKVLDPHKASYGVEDVEYAITQLAQTTMRSEIGKIPLDLVFKERDALNHAIVDAINKAAESWGMDCLRYEIRDITMPDKIAEAMQLQVQAERTKRATILESEGVKQSEINKAEGERTAAILASEADKQSAINRATGEAQATIARAEARARSLELVSEAIARKNGHEAVSLHVAENYIEAFKELAKETNTILLPTDTGNTAGMISQAMSIYKTLNANNKPKNAEPQTPQISESDYKL